MIQEYDPHAEFNEREKRRVDAFHRQDATTYATLCDANGVTPESYSLYNQGVELTRKLERDNPLGIIINSPKPQIPEKPVRTYDGLDFSPREECGYTDKYSRRSA